MFRCDICGKSTSPRTSCKNMVVKKVLFHHPERPRAKKGFTILKNGKKKAIWIPDPGGLGYQIAHESKMCPNCALKWERTEKAKRDLTIKEG